MAGNTTNFLWDRAAGLPELIDDGTTVTLQAADGVSSEITSSATTFDLLDGQGSVRAQTDGSGSATGDAAYDPWGNALGTVSTSTALGRFTTRDRVTPNAPGSQGWNENAYAATSPVPLLDPTGHVADPRRYTDPATVIDQLTGATLGLVDVFKNLDAMNPIAKRFVGALLVFGLVMLRQLIVMDLISVGAIVIEGIAAAFRAKSCVDELVYARTRQLNVLTIRSNGL